MQGNVVQSKAMPGIFKALGSIPKDQGKRQVHTSSHLYMFKSPEIHTLIHVYRHTLYTQITHSKKARSQEMSPEEKARSGPIQQGLTQ